MYLQTTLRCNMKCSHCCYSCSMRGKHGDFNTIVDAIAFARNNTELITIGGGEPTLHPRFFDILKLCLEDFDYVWMATNGSQTAVMKRLADIINGNDFENVECTCSDDERDYCTCYEDSEEIIYQEDKLSVALSQDSFHDPIDQWVVDYWTKMSKRDWSHYEIRNVEQSNSGPAAQGRAKKHGYWGEQCVCNDIIIKPDGKLKMCGCSRSPVIGDVWRGIDEKWEKFMEKDKYNDTKCYFGR